MLSSVSWVGLLPSAFMVQSFKPVSFRLLVKIIFPFILPFVSAVVGAACATELSAEASTFRVLVFVVNTNARQINKNRYADLASLNRMFRTSTSFPVST